MARIPTSNIAFSGINTVLGTPFTGTIPLGPNNIIRRLAGNPALLNTTTPISTADLAGKIVLADLSAPPSVSFANQGNRTNPVFSEATVSFRSDMVGVTPQWEAVAVTDVNGNITPGDVTIQQLTERTAIVRLRNDSNIPSVKSGVIRVTLSLVAPNALIGDGVVSNFLIRRETIDVLMTTELLDSGMVVAGETNVNAVDFNEAVAATTLVASSTRVSNPTFTFRATRVSGALATVTPSAATISFELRQSDIGSTSAVYDVDVVMFNAAGVRIFNQVQRVSLTATRNLAAMTISANTAASRAFSNNATFSVFTGVSLTFPSLSGTTINWTLRGVGQAALQSATINSSAASANVSIAIAANTFSLFRESYTVQAEQRYANGSVVTANSVNVTLIGGNIGHAYSPPPAVSVSGYHAQTAITTGTATVAAPQASLVWRHVLNAGVAASITSTPNSTSLTLQSTDRGVSRTAAYTISSVVMFEGQEIAQRSSSLLLNASFNDYTFTVTAPASNTTIVETGAAVATIVSTASTNIPGGRFVWTTNRSGGLTSSNSTSATSTLTVGHAESNQQTFSVTATLQDDLGRNVESATLTQQLRAGSIGLLFNGPTAISNTGFGARTFSAAYTATVGVGSSVILSATRLSGDTFTVTGANPLTISGATTFLNPSRSAAYRVTAIPTLFGIAGAPRSIDAAFDITQTGSGATISVIDGVASAHTATVTATGTATISTPPGFTVRWSAGTVTGGDATATGNVLTVTARRTSIGVQTARANFGAAIIAADGTPTGETFDVVVSAAATRLNPHLTLSESGSRSNEGFSTINSFADVIAAFDAPDATVTFNTTTLHNSTTADRQAIPVNGLRLQLFANNQIRTSTTRVVADLRLGGEVIATAERDVVLFAGSYFFDLIPDAAAVGSSFEPQVATGSQRFTASTNFPNATITWQATGTGTLAAAGTAGNISIARSSPGTSTTTGTITASILAAAVSQTAPYSVSATVQPALSVSMPPFVGLNINSDVPSPTGSSGIGPSVSGGTPPYSISMAMTGAGFIFSGGVVTSTAPRFSRDVVAGTLSATVTDAAGRAASAGTLVHHMYGFTTLPITIGAATDGTFSADTSQAGASLTTVLSPAVTGGNGSRTQSWQVISNPNWLSFSGGVVSSHAARFQQQSRTIVVRLTVTDQAGQAASRDFSVTHAYTSTIPSLIASVDTSGAAVAVASIGWVTGTAFLAANVHSGVPPYSYAWSYGPVSAQSPFTSSATATTGSVLNTNMASLSADTSRELTAQVFASCTITDSAHRSTTVGGGMSLDLWNNGWPRV